LRVVVAVETSVVAVAQVDTVLLLLVNQLVVAVLWNLFQRLVSVQVHTRLWLVLVEQQDYLPLQRRHKAVVVIHLLQD
jgi:hypothetical protein